MINDDNEEIMNIDIINWKINNVEGIYVTFNFLIN